MARKVVHDQRNDPLHLSQKMDLATLFSEARSRSDFGAGTIWQPKAGGGTRPSSIYTRGVVSLETAALEIEAIARTQPRVKAPVQHLIFSFSEDESRTISDETMIRMAECALDAAGFKGHQALFGVHRDTDNAHVHVAVCAVNPDTLRAWIRNRNIPRLHWGMREAEIAYGTAHDHGVAMVRNPGTPEQFIEWATKEELAAWRRQNQEERLQDQARTFLGDTDGLELEEDRRERIVGKIRKVLDSVEKCGEDLVRADIHLAAASLAATIEHAGLDGLRIRLMERAPQKTVERVETDYHGDKETRFAIWVPSEVTFDVPLSELAPDSLERRAWLADLGDVDRSEREYEALLARDPGRISRDLVADDKLATFTAEDFDRRVCSRLSAGGPEVADRVMREDPTLVVRSADTEQPLFTTKAQLALEQDVFDTACRITQQRTPSFDREKLIQALYDVEGAEARARGIASFKFAREQRAILGLIGSRVGTVSGVAGAGKSSLMAVISRYGELTGQPVIGLATAQLAAESLGKKAGIAAVNSTRGLVMEATRGQELIAENAIVIVDEYSMTSFASVKKILDRIADRPNATVLFIGGGAQLENIEAGNLFRVLTEATQRYGHHLTLTDVFRQKEGSEVEWMRTVVPDLDRAILAADSVGAYVGFKQFVLRGHVTYHADRKAEIAGVAADIVWGMRQRLRVIAPDRQLIDCKLINRAVRHELGHVGKGQLYQFEHRKREFSLNDRVVFLKNNDRLGLLNGYTGTVTNTSVYKRLTVQLDAGRSVTIDTEKYPHLEWGYAVTTHKSQGLGDPMAVVSLTRSDDARSAYVALTRTEQILRVHTHLKPEDLSKPLSERSDELLVRLTSPGSLRPKDDALLFEETVARTGGEHTPWARAVRRGIEQGADPLRQQHRDEMAERFKARGEATRDILNRGQLARVRAESIEEPEREQRLEAIAAGERRELESIAPRFTLESFVSWTVRRRKEIVAQEDALEREAELIEKARIQRERYEAQQAERLVEEQRRLDRLAEKPLDTPRVEKALASCVSIEGTAGEAYLRDRGLTGPFNSDVRYSANWQGQGAGVVFLVRDRSGDVVAAQARLLEPREGGPRMITAGEGERGVFATPGALESPVLAIAEAPIDALSLAASGVPALSLMGSQNRPPWLRQACVAREVLLAGDDDKAGRKMNRDLRALLAADSTLVDLKMPAGAKDPNQALQENPAELEASITAAKASVRHSAQRAWRTTWREVMGADSPIGLERALEREAAGELDAVERTMLARARQSLQPEVEQERHHGRSR